MPKKRHHRSKKDPGQEQWSDWYEHEDGGEYRVRLDADGKYTDNYEYRALQSASPEDEDDFPAVDQEVEDDYRGRPREQDVDAPTYRVATSTSPSKDVKPPPPKPPFQKSAAYRPSTPPRSPQPSSSTSSPYYIHTAASERTRETERTTVDSWNQKDVERLEGEPFYIDVESQEVVAILTANTECFITSEFADMLHLRTETSSQSKNFTHPVKSIRIKDIKARKRIEANIGYNGKWAESQRLYILPKDLRLDAAVFLSKKVFDHLQKVKVDTRGASVALPLRGSDQYQASYSSTNASARTEQMEQDPRYLSSAPLDEYDPGLQRSSVNSSSEYSPQQPSTSTDYEGGGFDSGYGLQIIDPSFTASVLKEGYSYGASASSNTPRYRK